MSTSQPGPQPDTHARILHAALDLFAVKGYEAVSMAEIAGAVGIKAPSLYKHFESKQQIVDTVLREIVTSYRQMMGAMNLQGSVASVDAERYAALDAEALLDMGQALFVYFQQDGLVGRYRRLLDIHPHSNEQAARLFHQQCVALPLSYRKEVFTILIDRGILKDMNPEVMALHFYAPLYLLLTMNGAESQTDSPACSQNLFFPSCADCSAAKTRTIIQKTGITGKRRAGPQTSAPENVRDLRPHSAAPALHAAP